MTTLYENIISCIGKISDRYKVGQCFGGHEDFILGEVRWRLVGYFHPAAYCDSFSLRLLGQDEKISLQAYPVHSDQSVQMFGHHDFLGEGQVPWARGY